MDSKYKTLKYIILSIIILIVVLLILIFIFSGKEILTPEEERYSEEMETLYQEDPEFEADVMFEQLKSDDIYFTVEKMAKSTVTYIKQINGIIDVQKIENKEVTTQGLKLLIDILDKEYIKQYNITEETLEKKLKSNNNFELKINKIYQLEISNQIIYYLVYAKLDNEDFI